MKVKQYLPMIDKDGKTVIQETGAAYNVDGRKTFNNPDLLADFFGNTIGLKNCATEYLYIAVFNNALKMIGCFQGSAGSSCESMFPIREILQNTLMIGGNGIAICHNHPTGNIEPSNADIQSTMKLKTACEIIGIKLLDHIIVGSNTIVFYSFNQDNREFNEK